MQRARTMTESKGTQRAAIEEVVGQFPFVTDCMTETSTAKRCKQDRNYKYSMQDLHRISEIANRREEIRLLLEVYRLKHASCFCTEPILGDRLEKRARDLRAEYSELRVEAEGITNEPLVSKTQAAANLYASGWYAEAP